MSDLIQKLNGNVYITDLQTLMDSQSKGDSFGNIDGNIIGTFGSGKLDVGNKIDTAFFKSYHNTTELFAFLDTLNGKRVEVGKTFLNNSIYGYYFGSGKKTVIVQGGLHAREWISPV